MVHNLTAWLYRPYVDLGPIVEDSILQTYGVEHAFSALVAEKEYPRIQSVLLPSFRRSIIIQGGCGGYEVDDPLALPASMHTSRWSTLCAFLERYESLNSERQFRVLWLLGKLCLYDAILVYADQPTDEDISGDTFKAEIAYLIALAQYVKSLDGEGIYDIKSFERIAHVAQSGSLPRINAAYQMVVQNVKHHYNIEAVTTWLSILFEQINSAKSWMDSFSHLQQLTRYYRVAGFLTQMKGDLQGIIPIMQMSEDYATGLPRNTPELRRAADEMLYPVLESRIKEALLLKDFEAAECRARRLTELCPLEPRARMHLGQVLIEKGKIEEALQTYETATWYGPPGTEIAYFMMGQCLEKLGAWERAASAYLQSLRIDPDAVSAAERLRDVGSQLHGDANGVSRWAKQIMEELQEQGSEIQYETVRPYQQYGGQLGR